MGKSTIQNSIVAFLFITAFVIFFKYDTGKKDELVRQLSEEFPAISYDQKLNATVTKIYRPYPLEFNDDPLQAYLLLNDSVKTRIRTGHELNKMITLDSVLSVHDHLLKESGSDLLFVYKIVGDDTVKYSFQLRDDAGYSLRKR